MNKIKRILTSALAVLMLFSASPMLAHADAGGSALAEAVIAEKVTQDAEGRIADVNDGNFLVLFIDDPERSELNTPGVYYSIYEAGKGWSEPGDMWANDAPAGNRIAERLPAISDIRNGQVFTSWSTSIEVFEDDATEGNICYSLQGRFFDKASQQFGSMVYIVPVDSADTDASSGLVVPYDNTTGFAMFTYARNSYDPDPDNTCVDSIEYRIYDIMSGNFLTHNGETEHIANIIPEAMQGTAKIMDYNAALCNGKFVLAYTLDTDGDLATASDRELYTVEYVITESEITKSEPRRLTVNSVEDSSPQFVYIDDGVYLVYQSGGSIMAMYMSAGTAGVPETLVGGGAENFIARDCAGGLYVLFDNGDDTCVVRYDAEAKTASSQLLIPIDGYRLLDYDTNSKVDGELVLLAVRNSDNALCALTYNIYAPNVSADSPYIGSYRDGSVTAGFTLTNYGLADAGISIEITDISGAPVALESSQATVPALGTYQFNFSMEVPYRYGVFGFTAAIKDAGGNELDRIEFSRTEEEPVIIPDLTYKPVIDAPEGVEITTDPARPEAGDTVTITVKPEGIVEVTDKYGNDVEVTRDPDGTWSYTQPEGAVTISVTPIAAPTFVDVSAGDWYYDAVRYVYANGLMEGTSAATFAPDANMTRAMLVTILWRMEGEPVVNSLLPFTDVPADSWFTEAVRWAASEGIVTGVSASEFAPNAEITREQLAAILYRYAGEPATTATLDAFTDAASVSAYAIDAMIWCVEHGIITGTTATTLDPQGTATRAQCATMLMRFMEM